MECDIKCNNLDNLIVASASCSDKYEFTTCSQNINYPLSNLQKKGINSIYRANGNYTTIDINTGCSKDAISTIGFVNTNLTCDAVVRIQAADSLEALENPLKRNSLPTLDCDNNYIDRNTIINIKDNFPKKIDVESYSNYLKFKDFKCNEFIDDCVNHALGLYCLDKEEQALNLPKYYEGQQDKETDYYDSGFFYLSDCIESCEDICADLNSYLFFIKRRNKIKLKYWRITICDSETIDIDISRLILDDAFQPQCNFDYNYSIKWIDDSQCNNRKKPTCSKPYREVKLQLSQLQCSEFLQLFNMQRGGLGKEFFISLDPNNCDCGEAATFYGRLKSFPEFTRNVIGNFSAPITFQEIV